ncbi:MAG TPA: BlaI/MecI/CopY family transcriptional regulator [Candidatus Avanaerovorax faecigallinarum]|nr:BlaI/MecI/CopY family transcriptional regulator [Candidatus Avanaerovorax faecigallinarum]
METPKVYESEYRFCRILWDNEPVRSTELVKLCREKLGWSKATTYTVIRRLSERGVVKNENAVVTSLISREELEIAEIDELMDKRFNGSLPTFVAAFTRQQNLSEKQMEEIMRIIEEGRGD